MEVWRTYTLGLCLKGDKSPNLPTSSQNECGGEKPAIDLATKDSTPTCQAIDNYGDKCCSKDMEGKKTQGHYWIQAKKLSDESEWSNGLIKLVVYRPIMARVTLHGRELKF